MEAGTISKTASQRLFSHGLLANLVRLRYLGYDLTVPRKPEGDADCYPVTEVIGLDRYGEWLESVRFSSWTTVRIRGPTMNPLAAFGRGLLWAAAIGIVAFSYGYYGVASGWLGLWTLVVLASASVGVLWLFRSCSKGIAAINYEMCLLAIWFGHLNGTAALGGGDDIEWFCISFLWPWLFFGLVGGIIAFVSARTTDSPSHRTTFVAASVLLAAAGLVACGFAQLRFCGEQPVVMFRAVRFFLQAIAFSPDGKTVATVGGISGWDKNVRLWNAATGRALGACEKERANNGMEKAAVQCSGNPPFLAASSYLSAAFPRSDNKIVVQTWDLATQRPNRRLQWDDNLEIRNPVFSRDGRWFVYANRNLRVFDLEAGRVVVELKRRKDSGVRCLAVSPVRDRLACATYEKELEIWNVAMPDWRNTSILLTRFPAWIFRQTGNSWPMAPIAARLNKLKSARRRPPVGFHASVTMV